MDFDSNASNCDGEEEKLVLLKAVLDQENKPLSESLRFGSCALAMSSSQTSSITQQSEKINRAIANNDLCQEKAEQLERILGLRLRECRQKLQEIRVRNPTQGDKGDKLNFRYISCGRPYFKDNQKVPPPDNEDTKKIKKADMYDFSLAISVPGWSVKDKSQFITIIHKMSIDITKNQINSKIAEIKRKYNGRHSKQVDKEIADLKADAEIVSKKPLKQLALPLDQEYDWELLANRLNRRHTAEECRSLWKLFLHPSINKNSWSKEEHVALQKIACENSYQDWDNIAKILNTGRTGYQCFVYYRTNICNSFTGKKWTPEETSCLKRLIEYYKEGNYIPWGKIAAAFKNRTRIQIYNKYMRLIEQRKGRFLPEEDSVILNYVERFGTNYKKMTNYLPGRSITQIRTRYRVLSKMRVSDVWTVEDDRKLIQIMTNQDSTNFSIATQHFPGRNRVKIRSRYVTLMKWMKKFPNLDLEHAPRRGARRLNHGQATHNLKKAVEDLKHILNIEVEKKSKKKKSKKKKINLKSSETEIEDAIVATVFTELVKKSEIRKDPIENEQIHLSNNQVVTSEKFNMTNIRKCLIFLKSSLSENDYLKTKYSKQFPNLGDNNQDVSLVELKSYSQKNTETAIECNEPNVWGTPTLSLRNYVFPPHYATITGCRALLSLVSSARSSAPICGSLNLNVLAKRNGIFRNQLSQLLERFNTLFTWPMILSNNGPSDYKSSNATRKRSAFNSPEVASSVRCTNMKKYKTAEVTEVVDLLIEDDMTKKKEVTAETQESEENKIESPF